MKIEATPHPHLKEAITTIDFYLRGFKTDISQIHLPENFTFPFCYDPHPLALIAARELQEAFLHGNGKAHALATHFEKSEIGKMFGVLVVQSTTGNLGYLTAFSGKIGDSNHFAGFVPPVFDTLDPNGFYKLGESELNELNNKIEQLEQQSDLLTSEALLVRFEADHHQEIHALKTDIKAAKIIRDQKRKTADQTLQGNDLNIFHDLLDQESKRLQIRLKELNRFWNEKIEHQKEIIKAQREEINHLKKRRKDQSGLLQQQLFEQYTFLNANGESKNLIEIFNKGLGIAPPSGAGECAAPKLLHFAFLHQLKPIALAEFWWGKSPASEVRRHGSFYPACKLKCEPILGHMLSATVMDPNPMLEQPAENLEIPIIYEDEYLVAINKPNEFLSVPGKQIIDSVYTRMKSKYPTATGPLIVHRLDMSTSGVMLIAKSKEVYQNLQAQFIKRKVKKTYVAILEGTNLPEDGIINLPLRVDLEDRPRQLVCYTYGKPALTHWKKVSEQDGETSVEFAPITGRTHQLRVHAAHKMGLNAPIKGDDLYGKRADRLYLHARTIEFVHPITRETLRLNAPATFD